MFFLKTWNDFILRGKKETFSHHHTHLKKSEKEEKKNMIKEPVSCSSSALLPFLPYLLSAAEAVNVSGVPGSPTSSTDECAFDSL